MLVSKGKPKGKPPNIFLGGSFPQQLKGVSAQIGFGVVPGGPEVGFHEGSTRVPPGFHEGSARAAEH